MTQQCYLDAVQRNSQRLYLIALSFVGQPADAEDMLQSVFLKLWQHKGSFSGQTHLDKWLTRVCVNECRSLLRTRKRQTVSLDNPETLAAAAPEPEAQSLISAVLRLPESYRTVIHLFYYEELSAREIASLLHVSEAAVKTRLSRGRKMLRQQLEEEQYER